MNIYNYDIVFQEVPDHIALAFYVCGCPLQCPGCHSPELWTEKSGFSLSTSLYQNLLDRYQHRVDCILFLGGEWHPQELLHFLKQARARNFKTALYTGLDDISVNLKEQLNFLKTGPWKRELGGLSSPNTNQIFRDLNTNEILNHRFHK